LVINYFNIAKSPRELAGIIQRSYYTVQYIVEMHEKEDMLTSKVRMSAMKIFTVYDKRWILRQKKSKIKCYKIGCRNKKAFA